MGRILGGHRFDKTKHGHDLKRYLGWGTLLDLRGDLTIHTTVTFGFNVTILTASHLYDKRGLGRRWLRKVRIDEHAWVCTRSVVYNSWIQEHAIVSLGSVVSNVVVPAWSIVAGNPAMIVGRYDEKAGRYVKFKDGHTEEMEKF